MKPRLYGKQSCTDIPIESSRQTPVTSYKVIDEGGQEAAYLSL